MNSILRYKIKPPLKFAIYKRNFATSFKTTYFTGLIVKYYFSNRKKVIMVEFSDGIKINTAGQLRRLLLNDGLYLVGEGMLVPMKDDEDIRIFLSEMKFSNAEVQKVLSNEAF